MGYNTRFTGSIQIEPPLNEKEIIFINDFSKTRHMKRTNGPYFIDVLEKNNDDVIDYNDSMLGQPGLWCQWIVINNGKEIKWNEHMNFYDSCEWMTYLIEHFLGSHPIAKKLYPDQFDFLQGHTLDGSINAQGEEADDRWTLHVVENIVCRAKQL